MIGVGFVVVFFVVLVIVFIVVVVLLFHKYLSPDHHCWLASSIEGRSASFGELCLEPRGGRGQVQGGLDEHRQDDHLLQDSLAAQGFLCQVGRRCCPEAEGFWQP